MALITGLLMELIFGQERFVVNPANVTAAAAETAAWVLDVDAVTVGMFIPSNARPPSILKGFMFSIQSRSVTSPFPSTVGTVESAPIDIPTIEARSSNASLLAVKSTTSSFVTPVGGPFVPLEVTSDCPPFKFIDEAIDATPDEELDEEKLDVFDNLEATLWPEDPEIEIPDSGELMFKSDTFLLLLLLLMMLLLLMLLALVVNTGSSPVNEVAS